LAVTAVAGLLVMDMAAPVRARPAFGMPAPAWVPARCADGAITEYSSIDDPDGVAVMRMSGWIQPCAEGSPTGFVVIRYFTSVGLRSRSVLPYASLDSPTAFDLTLFSTDGDIEHGALTAVCVAFDIDGRVACLKLDPGETGQPPVIAPTPTDDPRLLVPVQRELVYDNNPTCGTCV
jgi:hypothetical protein